MLEIYNFMLEINHLIMKAKYLAILKFSIAALILASMGFWIYKTSKPLNEFSYSIIAVMLLVVGFVIYFGFQALKDAKLGLSPVDEFSKRIAEKAAARTFKISIFMWLFGLFILDFFTIDSVNKAKLVIVIGMVGMTLIFLFIRLYLSRVGIDENKD
tara:strand:- start:567 stop:1037 length:471 start_codon:yes stop_codon:yes gene_type:complete